MKRPASRVDSKTQWARLLAMGDEEIERGADADEAGAPMTDAEWTSAKRIDPSELGVRLSRPKAQVTLRLDQDVLEWFKSQGPGYQTRMNAVLEAFKRSQTG